MSNANNWSGPIRFRGLSIQERLPLLICVILLSVMLTFALISYFSVRRAAIKVTKERLVSVADQLSNLFTQSAQSVILAASNPVNKQEIRNFFNSGGTESYTEASEVLQGLRKDTQTVMVQLVYPDRKVLLRSELDSFEEKAEFLTLEKNLPLVPGIGKLYRSRNNIFYPIIAPVTQGDSAIGYLVRWRIQSSNPQTIQQFNLLLGNGSKLYIANADGSVWSDLNSPVTHPPVDSARFTAPAMYLNNQGTRVIGGSKLIRGTPWQVTVEFNAAVKLQTARDFLRWIVIVGSILLIIGIVVAWVFSRNLTKPLDNLTRAATAIANGKYSQVTEVNRTDEVGKLARAFNAMSEQVSRAKKILEDKIAETEQVNEQLRELSAHLQNIREEERMHIAREMHDELGQLLTGFKMDVSWLNKKLGDVTDPAVAEKLAEMSLIVDDAVKFVRRIAAELRPGILDDLGLVPALDWHSKEFEKRFKINVDFRSSVEELKTSPQVATGLYRMYQESLTNVARHSNANNVSANLEVEQDEIRFSIQDDGHGFDTSKKSGHLGLLGMKERAAMIGGALEIISSPGGGTQVLIQVPLVN